MMVEAQETPMGQSKGIAIFKSPWLAGQGTIKRVGPARTGMIGPLHNSSLIALIFIIAVASPRRTYN